MISIVIPCYNEEKRIPSRLVKINKFFSERKDYELIFVNDGSKDKTLDVLKAFQKIFPCKIVTYEKNRGKGGAVKAGVIAAKGEIIGMMDADLATDLNEIPKIVKELKKYDVVVGKRVRPKRSLFRTIVSKGFSAYTKLLFWLPISDTQCGFKFFSKKAKPIFKKLITERWAFDVEFLYRVKKAEMKVGELPVKWTEQGETRLKPSDAIKMARDLLVLRFKI